ncbi:type II toxin-antitoxin system RelE/ParE family toxin [uncultured Agrobacterium sp.]|uniref:type II toxin-antitoxin system RelE/ParE family toxin n=1 Tax=uncultured Agrobacterium sp. TaxID=157277 RepID=UPI00338E5CD4
MGKGGTESLVPGCRTWVVGDYLLDYARKADVIEIVSVRHGRMGPIVPPQDPDEDFE